ncbi:hypothetical protein OYT13_18790 [Pandoraea sp. XJJ-1]|uniref:hypothetical protein n=1 Tax=Pandoraea sp. XJJ-1 TaxID=3002643 RepID=UPI00227EC005|nr:hypothetical protein [Pandoraea sp. XJJ-1]WAL81852.1 hypothetical protein OYT13_18790 [Pandoraea sp. XJJ-1]
MSTIMPKVEELARPKNPTLACVLSIVCVGAGQLYNDDAPKGLVMFFAAVLAGIMFGIAAWLLVIPLIGYAAYDAYVTAQNKNKKSEDDAFLKRKAEIEVAEIEAKTTSAQEFVDNIRKLHNLSSNGLLTESEFADRKQKAIISLSEFPPREPTDDFLTALIPLIKSQVLLVDDIAQIKALVF